MTAEVEIAAGRAREVVRAAQRLLTKRTGAPVVLVDPQDLGGSDRTVVLRVRPQANPFALPRTMVVKKVLAPGGEPNTDEAFVREVASYQFANSLPLQHRPGATLVAYDVTERLLVLDDLGGASTLAEVLLGADPAVAQRGLLAWAQALGRMHAATAGREDDYTTLLRRVGRRHLNTDPLARAADTAVAELPQAMEQVLGVDTSAEVAQRATQSQRLLGRGSLRAFSPADLCPDNALLTAAGVQFLDFEWGGFRDVALDAAYALVPFPACWCSPPWDAAQGEAILQAWRAEVGGVWPQLDDDDVLHARVFDAQLLWVWLSTHWFLPGRAARRAPSSAHPLALSASAALSQRWQRLSGAAESAGESATAAHARLVATALEATALEQRG